MNYLTALTTHGILASMSRRACYYDNAAAESFWHTLTNEWIHRTYFDTRAQAKSDIFDSIATFSNRTRRHIAIGNLSPNDFELQRAQAV